MIKKADWLVIGKDRVAVLLLVGLLAVSAVLILSVIIRLQPSDIQIPVRYTGFGQTFIYRDHWYTQYGYVGLTLLVTGLNGYIALKLYKIRRLLGLGLIGMSIFVLVFAAVVINAMFNLAPSL